MIVNTHHEMEANAWTCFSSSTLMRGAGVTVGVSSPGLTYAGDDNTSNTGCQAFDL